MTTFTVLATGPRALVQDLGRPGYAALGVPPSGALDRGALRLANRLVGNPESAPGIEVLLGGLSLRANGSCTIAVTGAPVLVHVGRAREFAAAVVVPDGAVLTLGSPATGMRSYLAVAGGIDVPAELGSAAADTLSGIGPQALTAGDLLTVHSPAVRPPSTDVAAARRWPAELTVPVLLGPRDAWFDDPAAQLRAGTWQVSDRSDRIGLRLVGPPLRRAARYTDAELPSEPIRTGAIQVPSGGSPLIFLADHPTTGGYPVIGVVDPGALDDLAQARPGTGIRFRPRH